MTEKRSDIFILFVISVLIQSTAPVFSEPSIVNYDNNPNLKKAMEYSLSIGNSTFLKSDGTFDEESYKNYLKNADRELAEKYYLAYLEDVNESFQRARVYAKLGDLYIGRVSNRVTSPNDVNVPKALQYYEKALAEAPEAFSLTMINVRGGLTMLPDLEKGFFAKLEYYDWLLSADEKKISDNWLPSKPGNLKPSESAVKSILDTINSLRITSAHNLVDKAVTLGRIAVQRDYNYDLEYDPKYLLQIVERFPGTKADELAKNAIAKLSDTAAEEYLKELPSSDKQVPAEQAESEIVEETSIPKNEPEDIIHQPFVSTTENNNIQSKHYYLYMVLGGILVLSAITIFAIKSKIK